MRRWWDLPEGWLSLFLLLLILLTVAGCMQNARWAPSLQEAMGILTWAAVVGLAAGFLLARVLRPPRFVAHLLGQLAGIAWIVHLSGSLRSVRVPGMAQPVSYLSPLLQGWKDLAAELLIRTIWLARTFIRGSTGEDAVLFVVVLAWAFWQLGFLGAWFTFRSHLPWLAVGLPGLVLVLNLIYGPGVAARFFDYYAFLALLFLFHSLWKQHEWRWAQADVRYPAELSRAVFWAGLLFSALLVLGTALLPAGAASQESASFWDRIIQPWKETREAWERLFSDVEGTGRGRYREFAPTFELGGAREEPDGTAFEVYAQSAEYLRAIAFDQYDGRGWTDTAENGPVWHLPAHQALPITALKRDPVAQRIVPRLQGGNMVFAYAEPVSLTLPTVVELGTTVERAGFWDIVSLRSRSSLNEGQPYEVVSLVATVDKESLRRAGQDYPAWVRERYLQLPDTLPERVRTLADAIVAETVVLSGRLPQGVQVTEVFRGMSDARELHFRLAGGEEIVLRLQGKQVSELVPPGSLVRSGLINPYDAAEAIQDYLRTQYVYRTDIAPPPAGADAVDHFLFESRTGYCDYFASAMVVLLRAEGIPARLVRGYAAGKYDAQKHAYVVPLATAHSWVEAYFPGYGWQRFEPTPAGYTSLPYRPERALSASPPTRRTPGPEVGREERDPLAALEEVEVPEGGAYQPATGILRSRAAVLVPAGIVTLLLCGLVALSVWSNRGLRGLSPVAAVYERMCRWAQLARLYPDGHPTPYEAAWKIAEALPEERPAVAQIVTTYVRERFGRHRPHEEEVLEVRRAWSRLRWGLWGHLLQRLRPRQHPEPEEVQG